MNQALLPATAAKDRTARIVASAPSWTTRLRNDALVSVDTDGVAHCRNSSCWDRKRLADFTTLVDAMFNGILCLRCVPRRVNR